MTPQRRAEIAAMAAAATPGPWEAIEVVDHEWDERQWHLVADEDLRPLGIIYGDNAVWLSAEAGTGGNATFIAHARQDVPDLLAEIARLEALREVAIAAVVSCVNPIEGDRGFVMLPTDAFFALRKAIAPEASDARD